MMCVSMTTVRNGLRLVVPHTHTIEIRAKGRWFGRSLLEILVSEFRSRDEEQYISQIQAGRIQLVRQDTVYSGSSLLEPTEICVQNKDVVRLITHKHEPPVLNVGPIPVVWQSNDVIVIDKPCSIPVHPTGKYFYNSITEILKNQLNLNEIFPCHRLDKLTSGVLILSSTNERASIIQSKIRDKTVIKEYLARVVGKFPSENQSPNPIIVDRPIGVIDTKLGFKNGIKPKKEAVTIFKLLKYNPKLNESIVLCQPLTGRTHQIRIHLNHMGFPIVNDPLYGPHSSKLRSELINSDTDITEKQFNELLNEDLTRLESFKKSALRCEECQEILFNYDMVQDMVMWLHSYRIKIDDDMKFQTNEPHWCKI